MSGEVREYDSLAEFNEEWEDAQEEPKEYWFINDLDGEPMKCELRNCPCQDFYEWSEKRKRIGNYFVTEEEIEKAVEKLKAWKRLEDNGFRFETFGYDRITVENGRVNIMIKATFNKEYGDDCVKLSDLDLLFGGEE